MRRLNVLSLPVYLVFPGLSKSTTIWMPSVMCLSPRTCPIKPFVDATTLRIAIKVAILSINRLSIPKLGAYAGCCSCWLSLCWVLLGRVLLFWMLLGRVSLCWVLLGRVLLCWVLICWVLLFLSVIMLSDIILTVVFVTFVILTAVMLIVVKLIVVKLNVVMLVLLCWEWWYAESSGILGVMASFI